MTQANTRAKATTGRYSGGPVGVATVCVFYLVPAGSAAALDLDRIDGLITETIAGRERSYDYDTSKQYGAETVKGRVGTYSLADGVRAGNYLVYPSVGALVTFDDNIYRSDLNKRSDWRTEITPELRFQSQLPRHVLDFSLDGKIVNYLENTEQDYANVRARAAGALHFDHAHTLSASVLSAIEHEEVGELTTAFTAANPIEVFHNRASVGITRDVGRLYGTLMATFERWDYADVRAIGGDVLDQDPRDTNEFSTALKLGYRFSPGFELIAKMRAVRNMVRGEAGSDPDAKGYEVLAGLAFETSPLLRWRLLAGHGYRDFDNPDFEDVSTALLEAHVEWLATQFITVTGAASREIIAADTVEGAGRIETRLNGRLDYEIWHNTVLNVGVELRDAEFVGVARRDTTYSGRIGLDYYPNRNWVLSLGYEHSVRESTEPAFDMTRNRFMVGAKFRY